MTNASLDQAVIQKMNELMMASSECAEFDPAMSAKFAATAKDLARDLGIPMAPLNKVDAAGRAELTDRRSQDIDDSEFDDLLHLLDLQKKAVAAAETASRQKPRFGWLGLDVWSRW
jgi:hypothetical protein